MNTDDMIMNVAETTQISDTNTEQLVDNVVATPVIAPPQQMILPERTRTVIRKYNKKVSRNEKCPCGSGKKYKNCCYPKYNSTRQLTKEEMYELRMNKVKIDELKEAI
jgi:uncharacterized protein YecA (UPF0149 family)